MSDERAPSPRMPGPPPSAGSTRTGRSTSARRPASAPSGRCPTCRPRRRWPSSPAGTRRWSWRSRCWRPGSRPGALSPDDAGASIKTVRSALTDAHAVGDLDGLTARLEALVPKVADQRAARKAERAKASAEAKAGQGAVRRRGGEAGRRQRLARRGQPVPRAAGRVEGPASAGPRHRRRAVAPVLQRPHDLHAAAQGPVRQRVRAARDGSQGQGEPGRRSRGAAELHRLGSDHRGLPGPDDPLEGRRLGARGCRRRAVEEVPRRPGRVLRRQVGGDVASRTPSSGRTASPSRLWSRRPRPCCRSATSGRPGSRTARSSSAGRPSARCRGR